MKKSFDKNEDYLEFGPRIGGAYSISPKLVARASYGLFFIPLSTLNSGFGSGYAANQNSLSFPTSQVTNGNPVGTAFNWDGGYPASATTLGPQNNTNSLIPSFGAIYIHPDFLHPGHTWNWYVGLQYELTRHSSLDLSYIANRGNKLQNTALSYRQNYPSWSTYEPILLAGHINNYISSAADAAAIGVPYPYPGFSGPAYAAIAPYPQVAAYWYNITTYGDPAYSAVSAYNSFVVEYKARSEHGLYADFSYTVSKATGNTSASNGNWGGGVASFGQDLEDSLDSKHWLQPTDQRQLLKGYITYQLPIGRNRSWLTNVSPLANELIGGWEIGYYGAYGSGTPMTQVTSNYQVPYYFNSARGFLAAGKSFGIHNHFNRGRIDLANLNDSINQDFDPNLFVKTDPQHPFGNTPAFWNHWRWNGIPAAENMSLVKHFAFGSEGRYQASLTANFFNVFNRHYYGAPDTGMGSSTFGQVTSVSGSRIGQVSARVAF
jgi:hypothetical protein